MTAPFPASLPPGCTATTASAHSTPLSLRALAFSSDRPPSGRQLSASVTAASSNLIPLSPSVPASLPLSTSGNIYSGVSISCSSSHSPAGLPHPFYPNVHPSPSRADFQTSYPSPSLPCHQFSHLGLTVGQQSPNLILSPSLATGTPSFHISYHHSPDPGSSSSFSLPTPPETSFGPVFGLLDCQMSQPSHAAAIAAAAGTPTPAMRVMSDSHINSLKMTPNPHLSIFATDSPVKTPLPSSLLASSSVGPVPQMISSAPSSSSLSAVSYAAAAAAATAAASASSLPPRSGPIPGPLFASFPSTSHHHMDKENMALNLNHHQQESQHRSASSFPNEHIYDHSNNGISHFQLTQPHMQNQLQTPEPKRLLDAAQLRERPSKKLKTDDGTGHAFPDIAEEQATADLPSPSSMPVVEDDGRKPPYSYATLIGMAILRSPNRRLTLAQIYKWITDHFSHYRNTESGWQNSIRHNLSLNKAFQKVERPKDDPGKGHYWVIQPGMEQQFLKDRPSRRGTTADSPAPQNASIANNNNPLPGMPTPSNMSSFLSTPQSLLSRTNGLDYSQSSRPTTSGSSMPGGMPSHHHLGHGSPSVIASMRVESANFSPLIGGRDSAHATPASSMQLHTQQDSGVQHRPMSRTGSVRSAHNMRSSPPPATLLPPISGDLRSSPPNVNGVNATSSGNTTRPSSQAGGMPSSLLRPFARPENHGTPPPVPPFPSLGNLSSDHNAYKDKQGQSSGGGLVDSGYWSSIDSSIRRPLNAGVIIGPNETDAGYERSRHISGSGGYGCDMTKVRGRAEEELARLRGNSADVDADTPSRTTVGAAGRWPALPVLSSPPPANKNEDANGKTCNAGDLDAKRKGGALKVVKPQASMIDTNCKTPLTPPVMFKRPLPEPASASPNTNLKNHRESIRQLLGSPDANLGGIMGDFHGYYDGTIGSSPLKGISPIKFNPDDWASLRTPVPASHKRTGSRYRPDEEPGVYNSSPVRNFSDHHEVYLNLVNTPKVYTPDSADGFKPGRILPPPYKSSSLPSANGLSSLSPEKSFIFPPPFKSPISAKGISGPHPFMSAPKLGVPLPPTSRSEHTDAGSAGGVSGSQDESASPTKSTLPWPSNFRPADANSTPSGGSRGASAPLSFPSLKKPRLGRTFDSTDDSDLPRTGLESAGRALAEVLGVEGVDGNADDRSARSSLDASSESKVNAGFEGGNSRSPATSLPALASISVSTSGNGLGASATAATSSVAEPVDQSSSPRGFDLMKGFVRIGSRTLINHNAASAGKVDHARG